MIKSKPSPDIDRVLSDLNQQQLLRFQLLFSQEKANHWLIPVAFSGLGVYALVATLLLDSGYSWLVVLIPALFVIFFVRSLLKGVVTDAQKDRQKDYGSIILPFVLISLFGLCGVLVKNGDADGGIVVGVGLIMIYPMALYYFRALIDKRNELLAESLISRIKNSPEPKRPEPQVRRQKP